MLSRADISSNANNKLNIVIIFKCPYVKWAIWKVQYNSQDCYIFYYIIGLFILGIKIRILSVIKPCRKTCFILNFHPLKANLAPNLSLTLQIPVSTVQTLRMAHS